MIYPITLAFPADAPICVEFGEWYRGADGAIVATFHEPLTLACALVIGGTPIDEVVKLLEEVEK